jgi:hypothetical protein
MSQQGQKFDHGKPRYDLVPWAAMDDVVRVLTYGAQKYAANNWLYVEGKEHRYPAAAFRHLSAYMQGEKHDPETGLSHIAHAMCSLLFILALDKMSEQKQTHQDDLKKLIKDLDNKDKS